MKKNNNNNNDKNSTKNHEIKETTLQPSTYSHEYSENTGKIECEKYEPMSISTILAYRIHHKNMRISNKSVIHFFTLSLSKYIYNLHIIHYT